MRTNPLATRAYSWAIVDSTDGRQIDQSPGRFRTPSLAWQAGTMVLARQNGSSKGWSVPTGG